MWRRNWKWIVGVTFMALSVGGRVGAEASGQEAAGGLLPVLIETAWPVLLIWAVVESIQRRRAERRPPSQR